MSKEKGLDYSRPVVPS